MRSFESLCNRNNNEPVDPNELFENNPELTAAYCDFYKRHDDSDAHSDLPTHGISDDGEVVILQQTGNQYRLASFHLQTLQEQEFTIVEKECIGHMDKTEIYMRAASGENEVHILLSRDGNQWKSGDSTSCYLRDMRLLTKFLTN